MPNKIVVFSDTTNRFIEPRNEKFEILTGELRKKIGDEALIRLPSGEIKQVMVEKSSNGFFWLVDTGKR